MRKTILIRTIKITVAAVLSIIVAKELALDFSAAAGIIAILNIFETRKATMQGGIKRTFSAIIALVIGGFLFESFSYSNWIFGLYLLIFVPVSFLLKIELGLGPSSVIVTHLLSYGNVDTAIIINEMSLVFIGTGFAMLTNFYAPNGLDELMILIKEIDRDMQFLLDLFGKSLVRNLDVKFYEDKIELLNEDIKKATKMAIIINDNLIENAGDILYSLTLREREMVLLKDMFRHIKTVPPEYSDGVYISDLLLKTSSNIGKDGDLVMVAEKIAFLNNHFDKMKLPQNHEEFVIRSSIYQVFRDLEQFIDLSSKIKNEHKF